MRTIHRDLAFTLVLGAIANAAFFDQPSGGSDEFIAKEVSPLLTKQCLQCHGTQQQKGGCDSIP